MTEEEAKPEEERKARVAARIKALGDAECMVDYIEEETYLEWLIRAPFDRRHVPRSIHITEKSDPYGSKKYIK